MPQVFPQTPSQADPQIVPQVIPQAVPQTVPQTISQGVQEAVQQVVLEAAPQANLNAFANQSAADNLIPSSQPTAEHLEQGLRILGDHKRIYFIQSGERNVYHFSRSNLIECAQNPSQHSVFFCKLSNSAISLFC